MAELYQVKISDKIIPPPNTQEISAAQILMKHFKADVYFVQRSPLRTADIKINGIFWEIKSPIGNGRRTIQNNLRTASRQSPNVIIDLRRCKMPVTKSLAHINYVLRINHSIKHLLVITKDEKVIDCK